MKTNIEAETYKATRPEKETENLRLMAEAHIPTAILRLAVPTVFSTIISIIYNLTDTYFIGLLDDPIQLGAISLAFPVFMILQAVGNMFGHGAPSYISRCLGAKDYEEARKTSAVSFYSSAAITLALSLLAIAFLGPILNLLGTSSETIGPTESYLRIILQFAVILTLQTLLPSLLQAEGKAKEAMIGMIIGTVTNIILDPVMILLLNMGVAGAAWATIIGNSFAVVFYVIVFLHGKIVLSIRPSDFKPSLRIFREVLKIGITSTISQVLCSAALILFNNVAAGYGDHVISAYGVASKMNTMEFMVVFGYVQGYIPFAGYNYGAGNTKRMTEGLKFTILTGTVICLIFLIPFTVLAPAYMGAFSTKPEIIEIGTQFLHAQAWAVPIMALQNSLMATFRSTGQAIRALIVSLGRQGLFFLPFLYLFNHLWGLSGLLYVQTASDLATASVAVLLGVSLIKKLHASSKQEK